jgi:transposase
MRPKGSQNVLAWRRRRAVELLDAGKTPAEVAEFLGVDRNTVYRWRRWYRRAGQQGIAARRIPGRPARLRPEHYEQLFKCLQQGAKAYGFATDYWTQQRIATLIRKLFGVTFCSFHVGRILAAHGWQLEKSKHRRSKSSAAAHSS